MAFQILPQEFHVLADHYIVRTRVPANELTDAMVVLRVRNANLSAGDKITVQCMTHEYDTLLYEAEFRVIARKDSIQVREINDRETRQVNETEFKVARIGEWWAPTGLDRLEGQEVAVLSGPEIRWNPGKQAHEVVSDGKVLASFTKDDGGKAAAEAFIAEQAA